MASCMLCRNLDATMQTKCFYYDKHFQAYQKDGFCRDFFQDPVVNSTVQVRIALLHTPVKCPIAIAYFHKLCVCVFVCACVCACVRVCVCACMHAHVLYKLQLPLLHMWNSAILITLHTYSLSSMQVSSSSGQWAPLAIGELQINSDFV